MRIGKSEEVGRGQFSPRCGVCPWKKMNMETMLQELKLGYIDGDKGETRKHGRAFTVSFWSLSTCDRAFASKSIISRALHQ
jgi:hypothetical protein